MRIALTIRPDEESSGVGDGLHEDLRGWLAAQPGLRGRVGRDTGSAPPPGTMGAGTDVILALLAPGGVATVLAGAVVAWLQARKGSQTVTLTRPDGTQITVSSTQVKPLDGQQAGELARQLAAALEADAPTPGPGPGACDDRPAS
ncbi:effector-associated constant component EACC1 [Streptomyces mirabilis]|uniref:effector-associated constant component EACC1 n=1 Tax=Streptomyces mirabilis TaxID=68239 RepID=UPI0036C6C4CE